uniref:Uncharacterized protein n=1 Tax=Trichinella nativa TaxID=6335 RepID=A0A0V1KJS9_9BILA
METLQDILDEKTIFIILDRFLGSESVHNDMSILQPLKLGL